MSVKGLMTTPTETITRSTTVMEACRVMKSEKVGALAVVEEGKLCGIFTYRDLVDRVILDKRDPQTTKLDDVMTTDDEVAIRENAAQLPLFHLDARVTYPTSWKQVFAAKFALYREDGFSTDTSKFWVWTQYSF